MKIFNKLSILIALLLVLVAGCNKAETAEGVDTVNAQGIQDIIAKNKGKVVLVNFWATWCPPCRAEIPELIELRKKFSDDDLVIIGVSVDQDSAAVDEFMLKSAKFNYPVYFAAEDVGAAFRIQSIPRTMLYDPAGQRVFDKEGSYPGTMFERYINKMLKDR
ncbi:TlpA family protein disulfide reductase [Maridesulfovibrio salexigens]|uniref:Redoxin domain protein n=1 Tax=Maridesulfovibrio salexigens (strain ATCC 14822 / DSM 2638 / NCIMB 8403 / VKM B-1763) TaxID=526222 RepID=C6BTZ7_MARSD|nr:TlpA disulfide reductase family protein [Maridesulfovibrio salexigens]ACS81706.1 Redoxin domain protein [Maridesulfovibrio salexigens DSM 2638]